MRPKAIGLAQHGGQPWLEESDPAGTVPIAVAAQLQTDGISSCCYIVNLHNYPS
jgi:hypothetical protein